MASSSLPSSSSRVVARPEWLASIDAVYTLFEHAPTAAAYPQLARKVRSAVELCEAVISEVGLAHCALSFNGGKDCTVLVHILAAVLRRLDPESQRTATLPPIAALYITCPSPFPEVERFIAYCVDPAHGYHLDMVSVQGGMKHGIRTYLDGGGSRQFGRSGQQPQDGAQDGGKRDIRAMFVGTRRDDPHGPQLAPRSWTDKDWPRVERIHPILDWTYADVWSFLRCPHLGTNDSALGFPRSVLAADWGTTGGGESGVPYCLLYDRGYTSLGSTFNTLPNPQLRLADDTYSPAYMLQDSSAERAGRIDSST